MFGCAAARHPSTHVFYHNRARIIVSRSELTPFGASHDGFSCGNFANVLAQFLNLTVGSENSLAGNQETNQRAEKQFPPEEQRYFQNVGSGCTSANPASQASWPRHT